MGRKNKALRDRPSTAVDGPNYWIPAGLAALSVVLYLNTLGHRLVFDDLTLITQNLFVRNLDWYGILFRSGYRPVRTLTYALNYAIGGSNPLGYHVVSVGLHAVNVVLLYKLLLRLCNSRRGAGLGALLFAVHPAQTAAVAYVSGRKDLLAAFFMMLAMLFFLDLRQGTGRRWLKAVASATSFVLAVLSKEVAIVFPALLLLVDALRELRKSEVRLSLFGATWRALRSSAILYGSFVVLASLGLFYVLFVAKASRMLGYWGGSLGTDLGTGFKLFFHYVYLVVFPYPLLADYTGQVFPISTGLLEPATLAAAAFMIAFLGFALWLFPRRPLISIGLLWFVLAIAPVLQFIPFHELAADHFLYVPLLGVALVVAGASSTETISRAAWKPIGIGIAVLTLVCSGVVVDRNRDWKDRQTLWEATLAKAPGSYRANVNLGQSYFDQGRFQEGIRLTRRALELAPDRALPYDNLGSMYYLIAQQQQRAGHVAQAEQLLREAQQYLSEAMKLDSKNPFTYSNLGNIFKEKALIDDERGEVDRANEDRRRAEELYRGGLALPGMRFDVQRIWYNLGLLFIDAGDYARAIDCLRKYVLSFPNEPKGNYWYGHAFYRDGQYAKAIPPLYKAIPSLDDSRLRRRALTELADSLQRTGRLDEAAAVYREMDRSSSSGGN